jgi:hypothetical protein
MRLNLVFAMALIAALACAPKKTASGPVDSGPPPMAPVLTTDPANGAMGVSPTISAITITSSEALDPSTVTTNNMTLSDPTGQEVTIAPNLSLDGLSVALELSSPLLQNTQYSLFVSGLKATAKLGGLEQAAPLQVLFTTGGGAPMVVATTPQNNTNGVATGVQPTVTFNQPVTDTTPSSIQLMDLHSMTAVPATVTLEASGQTAVIVPTSATCQAGTFPFLCESHMYSIVVGPGLKNAAGLSLAGAPATVVTFTTGAIPPVVLSTSPADLATNVPANQQLQVTFSAAMDAATITSSTITLTDAALNAVATTVSLDSTKKIATVAPNASLALGTTFLLTVTTGAKDYSDIAVSGSYVFRFSTSGVLPVVLSITPANMTAGVFSTAQIVVTFNEPVTSASVTSSTFYVTTGNSIADGGVSDNDGGMPQPDAGTMVDGDLVPDVTGSQVTFAPLAPLALLTDYQVTLTSGIQDAAGHSLTPFTSTFSTGAGP